MMGDNVKRFVLYGISGVYNYGCEAMIRTISAQIYNINNSYRVIYQTFNYKYDVEALKNCDTVEVRKIQPRVNPINKKFFRFLRRKLRMAKPDDYLYFDTEWTKQCDVLVIIGGDVFDLLPHQKYRGDYRNDRIFISQMVKNYGGKIILWGISVGDFESNKKAKNTLIDYFKNIVDWAIIRDKKSYNYLKNNGINNISLCSDPAFMQRELQYINVKKKILGVNLSPLANRYLRLSLTEEEWIEKWARVIKAVSDDLNYDEIYLIPHVVNESNKYDDDYSYLEKIYNILRKYKKVELLPRNIGFCGIKEYLIKCDLIFAARMHCAVNAITCGVPTVFLSYSPKSIGMCEYVYGNQDWLIDMNELCESYNSEKIKWYSSRIESQHKYLSNKNYELYLDAKQAIEIIMEKI